MVVRPSSNLDLWYAFPTSDHAHLVDSNHWCSFFGSANSMAIRPNHRHQQPRPTHITELVRGLCGPKTSQSSASLRSLSLAGAQRLATATWGIARWNGHYFWRFPENGWFGMENPNYIMICIELLLIHRVICNVYIYIHTYIHTLHYVTLRDVTLRYITLHYTDTYTHYIHTYPAG